MHLHSLVGVDDVHVLEGLPEELLLVGVPAVLVQGDEVQEDPDQGLEQSRTVLVHDVFKLKPDSKKELGDAADAASWLTNSVNTMYMLNYMKGCRS